MSDGPPVLPRHIEDTVQAIAAVHAEHYQRQAPVQRIIRSMVSTAARPAFAAILLIAVAGWVLANFAIMGMGREPWDAPPFPWLTGAASLLALFTSILILATQGHDDELAAQTAQTMRNVGLALAAAGAGYANIVKITTYVVNYRPEHRAVIGKARAPFFAAGEPPVSTPCRRRSAKRSLIGSWRSRLLLSLTEGFTQRRGIL